MVLQGASVTQKIKASSSLPSSSSRFSESAGRSSGLAWSCREGGDREGAVRGLKGGGERNVRRRVRLPRLRSRAYDLPLPRTTFNRGERSRLLPSFLNSSHPLSPVLFNPPPLFHPPSRIAVGGVTCFSTLRDLALSSPRGRIPFIFLAPSPRVTRKTRSCEQFFFLSPILQILYACECLSPTVTRSPSGESREDGRRDRGTGMRQNFE